MPPKTFEKARSSFSSFIQIMLFIHSGSSVANGVIKRLKTTEFIFKIFEKYSISQTKKWEKTVRKAIETKNWITTYVILSLALNLKSLHKNSSPSVFSQEFFVDFNIVLNTNTKYKIKRKTAIKTLKILQGIKEAKRAIPKAKIKYLYSLLALFTSILSC